MISIARSEPWWALRFDPEDADQWFLAGPRPISGMVEGYDIWQFVIGEHADPVSPLKATLRRAGEVRDWSFGSQLTPIVSERVVRTLREVDVVNAEFIPIEVEGQSVPFYVLNVLDVIDAVDEVLSEGSRFPPDDPDRPGEWQMIDRLVLRSEALGGFGLIYPQSWPVLLCASDTVVNALRKSGTTGLTYRRIELA